MHFPVIGPQMRIAKSHLYTPADSERKIAATLRLESDSYILDLEDGVAPNRKAQALARLPLTLTQMAKTDVWVRINSGEAGITDLESLGRLAQVQGVWIPKAEPGPIFDRSLALAREQGLRVGVLIESAVGYAARMELLSQELVSAVQIGEYDLRGDLGLAESTPATEPDLTALRLEVVVAAVANGVDTIVAGVSANFLDLTEYERSTRHMRNLGFNGRAVIHPAQIEICNRVFYPSEAEVKAARDMVASFEGSLSDGVGAYRNGDGNMTDAATVRRAQRILGQLN